MKQIGIVVEGQTEETFIAQVLRPHLARFDVYPIARLVTTNPRKYGRQFKGGMPPYDRFKNDVKALLASSNLGLVTTMIDYFRLPADFPGTTSLPSGTPYKRVAHLEQALADDIGDHRFSAYLSLHEFEALLLSDPAVVARVLQKEKESGKFQKIGKGKSPEEINEDNPPSHRITAIAPSYAGSKTLFGPQIASAIGLDRIRAACLHFNQWVDRLEQIGRSA